jgi:hypothetical protein
LLIQNKTHSDNGATDKILQLQGVSWLKRKAVSMGTVALVVKHYKNDAGVEHIDIDQTIAGLSGSREERVLNWMPSERNDQVFGHIVGKVRRVPLGELTKAYLKEGWTEDTADHGAIEWYVESDTSKGQTRWIADQVGSRLRRGCVEKR